MYKYLHTNVHVCTHTHTHIYTPTRIHAHTYALSCPHTQTMQRSSRGVGGGGVVVKGSWGHEMYKSMRFGNDVAAFYIWEENRRRKDGNGVEVFPCPFRFMFCFFPKVILV